MKRPTLPSVAGHDYNPNTREAEAGGPLEIEAIGGFVLSGPARAI